MTLRSGQSGREVSCVPPQGQLFKEIKSLEGAFHVALQQLLGDLSETAGVGGTDVSEAQAITHWEPEGHFGRSEITG